MRLLSTSSPPPHLSSTGDWFKVEKLIKETGGDDSQLVNAWNKIGQYYSDRHKWAKAAQYYAQVRAWLGGRGEGTNH